MSEVVIVSGRRRRWPEEVKRRLVLETELPGKSVCSVARRHELDPSQLYQWRRKFREADARGTMALSVPSFLPLDIEVAEQAPPVGCPSGPTAARGMSGPEITRREPGRMEIVLLNGRRLLLPLTVNPLIVKDLADILDGVAGS